MTRLIDANALMRTYAKFVAPSNNSDFKKAPTWNDAVSLLESAPTVDAEPIKHGKWISVTKGAIKEIYVCSRCNRTIEDDVIPALVPIRYPYCHCGAKMDEVEECLTMPKADGSTIPRDYYANR